ncbi:MAG: DUF2948 family protein [Alphaproteobacteria bacterium]|nr:DUF2948 family protein [Alphaproteobacteria bacterium]
MPRGASTDGLVRLSAADAGDLVVLSSLLQDAVVAIADMVWLRDEGSFVLVAARFRWEALDRTARTAGRPAGLRINCGLRIQQVRNVRMRGIDRTVSGGTLELSALRHQDGALHLVFAGGAMVRLEVDAILCHLEDFGAPWPTQFQPDHGLDTVEPG